MLLVSFGLFDLDYASGAQEAPRDSAYPSKNLLNIKVGVFKHLTNLLYGRKKSLFPSLLSSSINDYTSTSVLFPKACAADDLELGLSGSGDQIEFFNNFVITNNGADHQPVISTSPGSNVDAFAHSHVGGGIGLGNMQRQVYNQKTAQMQHSLVSSGLLSQHHPHQHLPQHPTQPPIYHDNLHQNYNQHLDYQPPTKVDHYDDEFTAHQQNLFSENVYAGANFEAHRYEAGQDIAANDGSPYFDDFNVKTRAILDQNFDDILSSKSSVSSTESYLSPLDDEFFRKLSDNYNNYNQTMPSANHFNEIQESYPSEGYPKKRSHESVSSSGSESSKFSFDEFAVSSQIIALPSQKHVQIALKKSSFSEGLLRKKQKKDKKFKKSANAAKISKLETEDIVVNPSHAHSHSHSHSRAHPNQVTMPKQAEPAETSANPFLCPFCDASFKVKGYLTRHLKKHSTAAFSCPFYQEPSQGSTGTKCHPSGGFSRRDTFKTHLKALHFIYPPGTKSGDRNSTSGRCAGCFEFFENNQVWLDKHIECGQCKGSVEYKLKSGTGSENSTEKSVVKQEVEDLSYNGSVKTEAAENNFFS